MDHYHATNKVKPDRLIFYRDGVSEGQFAEVQQKELTQIMAVCRALPGGYNPKITYIVVQKRHHTRIFPQDPREADRNGNVLAGEGALADCRWQAGGSDLWRPAVLLEHLLH